MNIEEDLDNWRKGRASLEDVRSLAIDLGKQHYFAGIPSLMELLDHDDELVRYCAVMSLAFEFHHTSAAERLLTMLAGDSDDDCRRVAAGALGTLCRDTKDPRILCALAKAALEDADEYVRRNAYKSLLHVNGLSQEEHLELILQRTLPVDVGTIERILADVSRGDADRSGP